MRFSGLSNLVSNSSVEVGGDKKSTSAGGAHTFKKIFANVCRFLLAIVFISSGFIKANDPTGTFYKLQEYFEAFGIGDKLPFYYPFVMAIVLGVIEFALGIHLFFGINRKRASQIALLFMAFMTPLTLWLAIANPISDCGCFGEAITLTNWETFFKNLVFLVAAIFIVKWNKQLVKLVSVRFDWLVALYGVVFIILFSIYTVRLLPIFDFTPYRIGGSIKDAMEIPEGKTPPVYETLFTYEKDGQEKEFTIEDLPTDGSWTFVKSKTVIKEEGYIPPIQDFSITLQSDGTDVTYDVLDDDGYTFLLVAPYLAHADDSNIDLVNEIYDYSVANGYGFLCVTCSSDNDIENWQEYTGAEYPFAIMDETPLKTMVRSNPGLILLRNGKVYGKWSCNNLPDEYELNAPLEELPMGRASRKTVRRKIVETVCWFVCPLALFTICDAVWYTYRRRRIMNKKAKIESKE